MRNLSYENEFCTQFLFHANKSHFQKNGFALRLALKQRHKGTRKWPIAYIPKSRDPFMITCLFCFDIVQVYTDYVYILVETAENSGNYTT